MFRVSPGSTTRSQQESDRRDLGGAPPTTTSCEDPEAAPGSANYRTVALIIACAMFMEAFDATVLATALPTMALEFHRPAPQMGIALTAYLLALAMLIPASGAAADRFGALRVFRAAIALFVLGSLACGLASNLAAFAVARFVQGIGGAMMMPVGRLVLLRSVAKRDMVSAMSWLLVPAHIGPMVGPPIGGAITAYLGWRWIFWLNVPIGLLGIMLAGRFLADVREPWAGRFDLVGFVLSATSLGCLLVGFEATSWPGAVRFAAALIAIGAASGALYLRHAAGRVIPILDPSLLGVPTFRLSMIGGSLTRITSGAQPFLQPLLMQVAFGMSAVGSGLMTLATAIGFFVMKGVSASLLRRLGYRHGLVLMGLLSSSTYAVCGLFRPGWPLPVMFAVMLVSGFLMSFQFTAYNTIAYDEIDSARMSAATSFYSTFQQLALSFGVCTASTALHISMVLSGHVVPAFGDFAAAFWTITAISATALFANLRFDRDAGAELAGR
ncbi:DHA2 family efflux MFS transporter permease subunit [Sphingomonas oligophenolica]|uniref:MFS transporter n=1 Tax=Sphingomonas oligophenolica TaxID=301154 RepID=A0ABU9Y6E1_9SPHN